MTFHEITLNDKQVRFRLDSRLSKNLEKHLGGKSLLTHIQGMMNVDTIITFLMYMRKSDDPAFNLERSYDLYDELIEAGYSMNKIFKEIIMECLIISGFITREELEMANKLEAEAIAQL